MKTLHLVATIALAVLLVLQASAGRAQALDKPDPAVRSWLPGCRAYLEHPESGGAEAAGLCAGAVDALLYIGEVLGPTIASACRCAFRGSRSSRPSSRTSRRCAGGRWPGFQGHGAGHRALPLAVSRIGSSHREPSQWG